MAYALHALSSTLSVAICWNIAALAGIVVVLLVVLVVVLDVTLVVVLLDTDVVVVVAAPAATDATTSPTTHAATTPTATARGPHASAGGLACFNARAACDLTAPLVRTKNGRRAV